jgi:uncharacterized membrane protein YphA (DoxX/SURF4 family)
MTGLSSVTSRAGRATERAAAWTRRAAALDRAAVVYARLALGAAFLSSVGQRFGLYGDRGWKNFAGFERYTAQVNSFMPAATIPFLAWAATVLEFAFGVALVVGFRVRWAAFGSAVLLTLFASAMAISLGINEPLDYSVFSAAAGALLLALYVSRAG